MRLGRQWALRGVASLAGWGELPAFVRLLIVAPHPDDETFGMGGMIAMGYGGRKAEDGGRGALGKAETLEPEMLKGESGRRGAVHIVYLTSGEGSHRGCCGIQEAVVATTRESEARKASAILGVTESCLHFLRLPDGHLPHPGQAGFEEASQKLADIIAATRPDAVFAPHPFEGWSDHVAAEEITREAIKRNAETLKAEMLKSESGRRKTEDGRRETEDGRYKARGKAEALKAEMLKPARAKAEILKSAGLEAEDGRLKTEDGGRSECLKIVPIQLYHYCVWFWFSMPLRKAFKVDWRNAVTVELTGRRTEGGGQRTEDGGRGTEDGEQETALDRKREAMRVYLDDLAPCGNPYCGRLPGELSRAFEWKRELFFKVEDGGQ